jgi:hypothetical protein
MKVKKKIYCLPSFCELSALEFSKKMSSSGTDYSKE